jgi:hypothetical protein
MDHTSIETGSGPEKVNQNTPPRNLAELEDIIAKGLPIIKESLPKYQEVGSALAEILSGKLYKPTYKSFKSYLLERWKISRAHGYRLIDATREAEMSPIGDKPANEHQARKRSASAKGKRSPEKKGKVILDLEAEFETFTGLISRWKNGLSNPDFGGLLKRAGLYLGNILLRQKAAERTEVAA